MRLLKRTLSAFLAFVMVFTMLPLQVWASETQQDTPDQPVNFGSMVEPAAGGGTEYDYTIRVGETKTVVGEFWGLTWTSDNSGIVKISDAGGKSAKIMGIAPGVATITHKNFASKSETFRVKVLPLVDSLTLDKDTMSLVGKQTEKLTASLVPENASVEVKWTSNNSAVATVDDEGNVTSVGVGTATITATASGTAVSDSCVVTVQEVQELAIKLEPLTLALSQTGTMALEYNPEPLGTPTLTWSVPEDSEIADIDPQTGVITPKKVGSVQVTATVQLGEVTATGTQDLTVTDKIQPTGIRLDKENMKLQRGAAEKLTATLEPDGAESKIVWSSSNARVATVDENGLVTSRGLGDTIITASVEGHPEIKDECRVNVEYDYATTGETKIYVYLEIKNETGKELEGWTINGSNFYTVGQYSVPFDILKPANHWPGHGEPLDKDSYVTRDISAITGYLPWTEFHPSNAAVVGSVDLTQIPWKLRYVTNGANHYQDDGACWHLDGLYTLKKEMAKVTVHYKDRFGNTIAESVTDNNIEIGDQYTIRIRDIPGYTPVSINGEPIKNGSTEVKQPVVGKDVTFTVIYNGNPTNYILEYKDIATREKIKNSETVESEKGKTILAKDIERKKIPNFEFVQITPESIQVGKDGTNTFTLWYKRNTHTVTYKYTDPITGNEVTDGPETKGAGLEVDAKKAPDIPGYTFNGWVDTDKNDPVTIKDGKFTMPDRDVTFTGSFSVPDSQMYAVRANIYLGNDANKQLLGTKDELNISFTDLQSRYGEDGYELANRYWNLNLTDNGEMLPAQWNPSQPDAGKMYTNGTDENEFHIVNIHLNEDNPALVTLTYDANGGIGEPDTVTALKNTEVTVSSIEPTRENYTFSGWNTAANGSGTSYPANSKIKLTDNTTLYAQWKANTANYTVEHHFEKLDGKYVIDSEKTISDEDNINTVFTRDALKLKTVPEGYSLNEGMTEKTFTITDDAGKNVFKIYYKLNTHTVTYVLTAENGSYTGKIPVPTNYEYDADVTVWTPEVAEGYKFSGWTIVGADVEDGQPKFQMPDNDVTLTGTISKREYTVRYAYGTGSAKPADYRLPENSAPHPFGSVVKLADPDAQTAEGYTFDGWYTNEECTDKATDFKMPARDVTIYGKFSKRADLTYTVKYLWNGTEEPVQSSVTVTGQTFGETVTVQVPAIAGHTPVSNEEKSVTITAGENVVNIYYYKNVTLTANSDNNRVYDGEPQSLSGYTASVKDLTFSGVKAPTTSGTNADKYDLTFEKDTVGKTDSTGKYIVAAVTPGTLTINPKPVTLSTEDASKAYDGAPLTKDGVSGATGENGFIPADVKQVEATGTQTLVGESKNTIKIAWTDDKLAKNYTITETLGTLTVTAPEKFDYVQKDANDEKFAIGQEVTFTITVTNIYDVPATVQLNEQKDMTITGVNDKRQDVLRAGETKTYSVSYVVTEADVEAGQITNKVTWTLTPHDKDVPPVRGDDESIIKNKSYLVWYVLEGDTKGCTNLDDVTVQENHKYATMVKVWMPELAEGYEFSGWTVEGAEIVDGKFTMPENAVILTGTISKEQVKVTYSAEEGGLVTDPKSGLTSKSFAETLSYGANAQGAVAVANEGYTFLGWKRDSAFVEQNEVIAPTEVKESVTYTAVFAKNYTVTYRVEGETGAYATQTHYAGETGVEVLDNAPAKTGYDFSGWTTADTTVLNGKFTMPEQDVLFTGSYTAHTNLVWYVLEGDREGCTNIGEMPKQANYAYDTVMTVWMPELAEGYEFSGWTVEGAVIKNGAFSMPDNAVILRGTISKEQVKVDYKAQEGGLITDSNGLSYADLAEMVPYGENAKGATASAKKGYTFVEWQDANHKKVSTDPEFIPPNVTAPATYYAVFAKQKVKVEYTADVGGSIIGPSGATFSSVIEQVTYGEDAVGATASAKPGYYFVRWVDAEGNQVGTELSFAPKNVTKEAVYKAVFAKYYAVNYVPVGTPEGTVLPQPENPYREGDEVVLMEAPKVDGYKFEGWYKDADCTEKAENFVMPAEDVTIYGKFERAYKVTYRLTDGISEMGVHFTIPDDFKPIDPAQYKPGEEVKVADEQILHDLDFTGWYCVEGNVKVEDGVFTMPAEDVVFEGGYVIRAYGVRHYFQDLYNPEKYIEQKNMSEFFLANGMEMTTAVALPAEWTPNVHALPFEQLPILPFQETVVKIKYDRDWYDVTYQLEGDVIPTGFTVPETKQHAYTATVTVAKAPRVEGYTFTGWTTEDATVANGKFAMPNNAVTLTGKFELATDTKYTVEHYFENLGGGYPSEPNHTESKAGTTSQRTEAMPIPAGSITGFTVDGSWKQQTIKPDGSTVVKIYYTRNSYNLTIHYRNVGGEAVADSHHGTYKFGETWKIVSPIVAGYYEPHVRSISSGPDGMPAQDLEYVVTYTAIPAPVDPDPDGPNPGPNVPDDDDDDDDTPPVPDPEQEQPQPPEPEDFVIDPNDYTLTEVEDNETPLANMDLDGHTCCIMHLLLMLAAMVVLGFYTKSRKKHQARIFELKRMLAMDGDHSDDPEQP